MYILMYILISKIMAFDNVNISPSREIEKERVRFARNNVY